MIALAYQRPALRLSYSRTGEFRPNIERATRTLDGLPDGIVLDRQLPLDARKLPLLALI